MALVAMVWILSIHVVGWSMGKVFLLRIGFQPVWFFDCTSCLAAGLSLPYSFGPLSGMSLLVVAALVLSAMVWLGLQRGMPARQHQILSAVTGGLMTVFSLAAFATRYPGSLPSVVVAVIPSAVAAALFVAAAGPAGPGTVGPIERWSVSRGGVIALLLGIGAVVLLGGAASVAAVVAGALAWERADRPRCQRYAALAVGLGIASGILRWTLVNRYEWLSLLL